MSDFSDRPLVADSITGVRSFRVDSLGRLTGVSYPDVWRPGENTARCGKDDTTVTLTNSLIRLNYIMAGEIPPDRAKTPKPEHHIAALDCSCGFYAYTDREANRYHEDASNVLGIVRGSGVATVGSRGFRAERAEIVALVSPRGASPWGQLCRWAGRFGAWFAGSMALSVPATIFGVTSLIHGATLPGVLLITVALALLTLGFAAFQSIGMDRSGRSPDLRRVRLAYPDVPVFKSLDAATRAFPLSTPPAPLPTDEDFWTRSAL